MSFSAGLDWGASTHAVRVIDDRGAVLARFEARHDAAGLADLLARPERIAPPDAPPVAIERPSGLVVDALVAAGHPVVPIHPDVVKACRPRHRAAGGKSDPGNAHMLADILRTDGHRFRPLAPVSDLPDGRIVMSPDRVRGRLFPRAGRICAAQIPAELGDVRARFGTDAQLAAEAGVCPSPLPLGPMALQRRPHASGKSRGVVLRWACNHRLRAAVTCFADNSRHASPRAADVYRRARERGCDHAHAIRVLAHAWTDRTPCDPARHNAAQALARAP